MRNSESDSRNAKFTLGTASRDLSNTKPTILGATHGAIAQVDGHPHVIERFSFDPAFSERLFNNWSGPARQNAGANFIYPHPPPLELPS